MFLYGGSLYQGSVSCSQAPQKRRRLVSGSLMCVAALNKTWKFSVLLATRSTYKMHSSDDKMTPLNAAVMEKQWIYQMAIALQT